LDELGGPFAVRSSATVEDSGDASFAGQFTTVLGASTREDAIAAVREVWESGASPNVEAYRSRLGLTSPVRMAVVVQRLVDASTAGVLFFDPSTDEQVVEASWGFGETVVDGSLSPDRYRIDGAGRELSVEVGDKRIELIRSGDVLLRRDVASDRALRRCLTAEQLVSLANLGREVSSVFGDGRDIEWAIVDDELRCLQARPITRVVT
jgi:pyruvate,water dikinase